MLTGPNRPTVMVALLAAAVLVGWVLVMALLVPAFVQLAHQGALPPALNDLLPRRSTLSLEHYLARVHRIGLTVLALLALGGLAAVAVTRPGVQRWLDRRLASQTGQDRPDCRPMTRRRWLVVNLLVVFYLAGHGFDIVTRTEHWPFSHYGMFTGVAPARIADRLSLYGVTDRGTVSLNVPGYFAPLDDQRLRATIKRHRQRPDDVERVLRYAGARYEALRRSGAHDGPRLLAVQLVEASWARDPWAGNRDRPDAVRVLHEVRLGEGAAR